MKNRRDQEMEDALKELKEETKRYRGDNTFAIAFAKNLKKIQKAQLREQQKIFRQKMREVIKEEKKRPKSEN